MALTAKQKRVKTRLQEIQARAAQLATNAKDKTAANLAEEAAGLGLELLDEKG